MVEKVAGEMDVILLLLKDTPAPLNVCTESAAVIIKLKLPLRELI